MSNEQTKQATDALGLLSDRIDNLLGALQLPVSPAMHVSQMKAHLPEVRDELRHIYFALTGDNPWE